MRAQTLYPDESKRKALVKALRNESYRYRLYSGFMRAFHALQWVGPLVFCVLKAAGLLLRGGGIRRSDIIVTVVVCATAFLAFLLAERLLRFLVSLLLNGTSLDDKAPKVELSDSLLLYTRALSRGKREEALVSSASVQSVETEAATQKIVIHGDVIRRIRTAHGQLGGEKHENALVLHDFFEPSLTEALKKTEFWGR